MTQSQLIAGFLATMAMMLTLGIVAAMEPVRLETAQIRLQENQIVAASQDYLAHCAGCHGSQGQGMPDNPPLDTAGMRGLEPTEMTRLIARGVGDTMPPASAAEGGVLTVSQIDQLTLLVRTGGWDQVKARVAAAGNLALYVEHCGSCHGLDGSGTKEGPRLDTRRVRLGLSLEEMMGIIEKGTPDEEMPGFSEVLAPAKIDELANLLRHWEALVEHQ